MTTLPLTAEAYAVERLPPGWATADVTLRHTDGRLTHRTEIIDLRSTPNNRYLHEPVAMIAFKCFLLFAAKVPLYFLVYSAYQILRTPIVAILHLSSTALVKEIWAIARIPFYFIALELAALYGILKPLEGRALFNELERALHGGKGLRQTVEYQKERPPLEWCKEGFTELEPK